MKRQTRKILLGAGLVLLFIVAYFFAGWPAVDPTQTYGVTWSAAYARQLGLDPMVGLRDVLDDLKITRFRLPVYWSEVEPRRGVFVWDELDRELDLIAAHHGQAILSVGLKQPRWPECWIPDWAQTLSDRDRQFEAGQYVAAAVRHFARHPALAAWQVENEPFLPFGTCDTLPRSFVKQEIELVKVMEAQTAGFWQRHPVLVTDSGELSSWIADMGLADGLGTSVYRTVINPWLGTWRMRFLPPWFYARKAALVSPWTGPVFVSEFQMEPWATRPLAGLTPQEQFVTFDQKQMQDNLWYAERLHLSPVYFWGAEWWEWMKTKKSHPEFWEMMQRFLRMRMK